ncbi:hypothetical protein B0H14DRAFT_3896869 [Mycena olivaceomarginata]|nr:hypothetical protein B0H14DRAFT_3896869 [Mycena olivaceomarginata]
MLDQEKEKPASPGEDNLFTVLLRAQTEHGETECSLCARSASTSQHHTPYPGAPRVPAAPTPAVRARRATATEAPDLAPISAIPAGAPTTTRVRECDLDRHHHSHAYAHAHLAGPYRDEDVLLLLQVLAYLSKYPHVRQALYKRRNGFHLVSALATSVHPATHLATTAASTAKAEPPPPPRLKSTSADVLLDSPLERSVHGIGQGAFLVRASSAHAPPRILTHGPLPGAKTPCAMARRLPTPYTHTTRHPRPLCSCLCRPRPAPCARAPVTCVRSPCLRLSPAPPRPRPRSCPGVPVVPQFFLSLSFSSNSINSAPFFAGYASTDSIGLNPVLAKSPKVWQIPFGFQLVSAALMLIGLFTVKPGDVATAARRDWGMDAPWSCLCAQSYAHHSLTARSRACGCFWAVSTHLFVLRVALYSATRRLASHLLAGLDFTHEHARTLVERRWVPAARAMRVYPTSPRLPLARTVLCPAFHPPLVSRLTPSPTSSNGYPYAGGAELPPIHTLEVSDGDASDTNELDNNDGVKLSALRYERPTRATGVKPETSRARARGRSPLSVRCASVCGAVARTARALGCIVAGALPSSMHDAADPAEEGGSRPGKAGEDRGGEARSWGRQLGQADVDAVLVMWALGGDDFQGIREGDRACKLHSPSFSSSPSTHTAFNSFGPSTAGTMGMNEMNIKTEDGDFPAVLYPTQRHAQAQGEKWLPAAGVDKNQ